jgi:hypothetical protein
MSPGRAQAAKQVVGGEFSVVSGATTRTWARFAGS